MREASEDVGMMRAGNEARKGDWMEVYSGTRFFPLDPRPEEVHLEDIAHSQARQNRYNGHIQLEHYSVAEHSVLMALWLLETYGDPFLAYQGLFHDGPEAYVSDMVRPLKRQPEMSGFVGIEQGVYTAIVDAFPHLLASHGGQRRGFYELDKRVKEADNRILVDERAQVMRQSGNPWGIDHLEPLGVRIFGQAPNHAKQRFLWCEDKLAGLCEAA